MTPEPPDHRVPTPPTVPREVVIVPHTHWDREWYAPFQTFRMKLVELLDDLLPLLEREPGYRHFMLDGQMAVVDDYLAMRPSEEARLRRLASAGRLGMGPWYILMDEFLVSGETMIRDLQLGLERAAAFGGASDVAYLPDMFGHIAQMPQILQQFGFEHTVVWRGVPHAVDRSGFWWTAPDGSTVRAEYLPDGYGNGAALPAEAKDLVAAVARFEHQHGDMLVGPILWMNGTDHLLPQPWLARVVAEANEIQDDYVLRIDSLSAHVHGAPTEGLADWTGELRSGARSNLLMGVGSNRVDVKQAAAATERQLERYAEPLTALYVAADRWPAAFLAEAWLQVVRNSAHDSSCACSHDEVVDAVLVRYQEARQIADGLTSRAVDTLASLVAGEGPVAVNASARTRGGLVEVTLPGHEAVAGTQLLERQGGDEITTGITRADATLLVQAAIDRMPNLHRAEVEIGADGLLDIHLTHDPARLARYDGPVLAETKAAAAESPDGPARLTLSVPPRQRALAYAAEVPGFGWARLALAGPDDHADAVDGPGDDVLGEGGEAGAATVAGTEMPAPGAAAGLTEPVTTDRPVPVGDHGLPAPVVVDPAPGDDALAFITNGEITVTVAPDGTFGLTPGTAPQQASDGSTLDPYDRVPGGAGARTGRAGVAGLGRLVDDGDAGDTYNYNPPARDRVVDTPETVAVRVLEGGPLRARVAIDRRYTWPERVEADARVGSRTVDTTTVVEVVTGSPVVRVTTTLDNPCEDHRLRAWFPLFEPADRSRAECAFAVVERGLTAEGGPSEKPLPTFPSRRFVAAGGLTVVHDGLLEYELVDLDGDPDAAGGGGRAGALALTLLRCTGSISRGPMPYRPLPAGPSTPTPGAQMPGRRVLRYGVCLGDDVAAAYAAVDDAFVPLLVGRAGPGGSAGARGTALTVEGAEVSAVLRDAGGRVVVRMFNPLTTDVVARVAGRHGWRTDLRGRTLGAFDGDLPLGPGQLATVVLAEP